MNIIDELREDFDTGNLFDVVFSSQSGVKKTIAKDVSCKEAFKEIAKFLNAHNYVAPYTRISEEKNRYWVDVGSYIEFFYLILKGEAEVNE